MSFKSGDKIRVVRSPYVEVPEGATGEVLSYFTGKYAVYIDGIHNPRSQYGCFYFKAKDIQELRGGTIMDGNYRIAMVKFLDGADTDKTWPYACYDDSITVDDNVVVMSAHHGIGVGQVVLIRPKDDEKIIREVICKADFSEYNARLTTRKVRAELESKMKQRAAELQELSLYKMLADHDPAMKELLNQYEGLGVL